jgi:hypothetical protein
MESFYLISQNVHLYCSPGAGGPRARRFSPGRVENLNFCTPSGPALGTGALCQGVKRPGSQADNPPPTGIEAKNTRTLTSSWRSAYKMGQMLKHGLAGGSFIVLVAVN